MKRLIWLLLGLSAFAQSPISANRSIDWSTAGIPEGIPNRTTICTTLNPGATAAQINSALATCTAGQVVFLNAGTYNLTTGIDIKRSNVTLRGSGADKTSLISTGFTSCGGTPMPDLCVESTTNSWIGGPDHTANWTAGYAPGSTQITLSSTSGIVAGSTVITLDQTNDSKDSGGIYVCETQGTCSQEGPAGGERSGRAQQQSVLVTAVNGNTVTVSPAIRMPNWRASQAPGASWANAYTTMVGIEDLSIDHSGSGAHSGIAFNNSYKCWVKGVRSIDSNRSHVWLYGSSRIVVDSNYFYATKNGASESYGVEPYGSSDSLIENNIFQDVATPMQVNGAATGTVFGYNYTNRNLYTTSPSWMIAGNSLHAAGVDFVLFEGNQGNALIGDNIHGTHNFITAFRNQYVGWETGKTTQTNALQIYAGIRFLNIVGNVLGKAGYHKQYQDIASSGTNSDSSIYTLGWSGNTGTKGSAGPNDLLVASSMLRWGNCDTVNNSCLFNASEVPSASTQPFPNPEPASHTLPASLYRSSPPPYWGSTPWPDVGPDVTGGSDSTGHVYPNMAQKCFSSMGGTADGTGPVLSFNRASCYPVGGGTTLGRPNPPTGTKVSVN